MIYKAFSKPNFCIIENKVVNNYLPLTTLERKKKILKRYGFCDNLIQQRMDMLSLAPQTKILLFHN